MTTTLAAFDRIMETSTTVGTGAISLAGAITGFLPFSTIGNDNYCFYCIQAIDTNSNPTGQWEVGKGQYVSSGNTLSRIEVLSSSSSNTLINFSSGTKQVYLVAPAQLPSIYNTDTSLNAYISAPSVTINANQNNFTASGYYCGTFSLYSRGNTTMSGYGMDSGSIVMDTSGNTLISSGSGAYTKIKGGSTNAINLNTSGTYLNTDNSTALNIYTTSGATDSGYAVKLTGSVYTTTYCGLFIDSTGSTYLNSCDGSGITLTSSGTANLSGKYNNSIEMETNGSILINTSPIQTYTGYSLVLSNNTATSLFQSGVVAGTGAAGFIISYSVVVYNGTDLQIEVGECSFAVINKGGSFTNTVQKYGTNNSTTSGTLSVTFTVTTSSPSATVKVNANSSLTPSTGYPLITWEVKNLNTYGLGSFN